MKTRIAAVESQTFNGSVEWGIPGNYFKLLTAAAACGVELFSGGTRILNAPAARRGFYQGVSDGFDRIRITNTGSQLIEFLIAGEEGGSDAFSGSLDITSPLVADNADAQAAAGANGALLAMARMQGWNGASFDRLRAFTVDQAGILGITNRGIKYGVAYKNNTPIGVANTAQTILAAGSNVNGVIVWGGGGFGRGVAHTYSHFVAHTASPTAFSQGDALGEFTAHEDATGGADLFSQCRIDQPTLVPAGKGLYWFAITVESIAAQILRYTVL